MPIEIPEVRVVDDPVVVYGMVILFAAVALLALYFASPWAARMPSPAHRATDEAFARPTMPEPDRAAPEAVMPPGRMEPARPAAKVPWSTSPPDADPPWHARPGAHDLDD
jgi:hypothetical protein